jgi:UDP-glucose 4-epimerase
MKILVLGGTGFAGQVLIRHLNAELSGVELSVVSRSGTDLLGVDRVFTGHYAHLSASADFRRKLAEFDAVVHLADGLSILQARRATGNFEVHRLIDASERFALAAREVRLPLFIYVSSIKAVCDEEDARVLVETSEPRSTTLYGQAKLRLEEAISTVFTGSPTRHVILRNPVMYGEGKAGSLLRLLHCADTPYPLPLAGVNNRRSILSVRNLASALTAVLRAGPSCPSGVFHIHDGLALSTTEIVETFRRLLGRPRRLFRPGAFASRLAREIPLIAPTARRLYGSLQLSDAHFRRAFRWKPMVETKAGLAEMAERYAAAKKAHLRHWPVAGATITRAGASAQEIVRH